MVDIPKLKENCLTLERLSRQEPVDIQRILEVLKECIPAFHEGCEELEQARLQAQNAMALEKSWKEICEGRLEEHRGILKKIARMNSVANGRNAEAALAAKSFLESHLGT